MGKLNIERLNELTTEIMNSISEDLKEHKSNDACEKIKALADLLSARATLV